MRTDIQTDGRTGMTKLTVAFRNFANESKKVHLGKHLCDTLKITRMCQQIEAKICYFNIMINSMRFESLVVTLQSSRMWKHVLR